MTPTVALCQALAGTRCQSHLPPREDAVPWSVDEMPYAAQRSKRNAALQTIEQQGRKAWKDQSGCHRRSLAKTAILYESLSRCSPKRVVSTPIQVYAWICRCEHAHELWYAQIRTGILTSARPPGKLATRSIRATEPTSFSRFDLLA